MNRVHQMRESSRQGTGEGRTSSRRYSRFANRILGYFALHRLAVADQVQRAMPDCLPSDRSARMHLQTLVEAGDLRVIRHCSIGQPNVYEVTTRGMEKIAAGGHATVPSGRRQSKGQHLLHELLVTEFAASLIEAARARADIDLLEQWRFELVGQEAFAGLVPDYGFLFRHPTGMLCCLVEVSSGEESSTRIRDKLERYSAWPDRPASRSFLVEKYRAHGAQNPRPQFRLAFLVENRRSGEDLIRLSQVFNEALRFPPVLDRLWGTTVAELGRARSLDSAIWLRGLDLAAHRNRTSGPVATRNPGGTRSVLQQLPKHPFFPELPKVKVRNVSARPR